MIVCPACGAENREGARFCDTCGAALAVAEPKREMRKTVTVLFCDIAGSTALGERLDPEATRKLMARYFDTARGILERHGASVEKFIGDAVMAVFGIPQVHEDDALRAARAALELRDSVQELELRIGVNTGEVVAGGGETLVTGDAVNVAARLEQAAQPGEVLIGQQAFRLIRDAVDAEPVEPVDARGKSQPVVAYRLVRVRDDAEAFVRRLDAPLVGRDEELAQLEQAFTRAVRERSCNLFTLLGPPGIGKSRLAQEFLAQAGGETTVLAGRCLSYGEGITYWPLVEILRELGSKTDVVQLLEGELQARPIVNDVFVGVGLTEGSLRPEETSRAVRRLFEALARERPLVVVLDDLQWAEPTFLDLVEHVADLSRDAPILLLCLARPDLLDARTGWSGGKHNATTLLLEPLTEDEAETLIGNLLAGMELDDTVRERIASAAEGNPLFVEQMLAMIGDEGGEVVVPPTIHALLSARLDRLEPDERATLERASIVGKEFWQRAIADLGADAASLPALVRKELIRPHRSTVFPTDDAYRFRHQLIRDVAYEAIPKELRAELHERFAGWMEGQLSEYDEIVGYHLEQAYRYRAELGEPDEQARELATRAGQLLARAARRTIERGDVPATINLLGRAIELFPADDERRLEALADLGWVSLGGGAMDRASAAFTEAVERSVSRGADVVAARANVGLATVGVFSGAGMAESRTAIGREIAKLEQLGDPDALAEAEVEAAKIDGFLGRTENADRFYERALRNARQAGNRRIEAELLSWQIVTQCWGYLPATEGIRRTTELLEGRRRDMVAAFALSGRGRYRGLRGDLDAARHDLDEGLGLLRDFGAHFYHAGALMLLAHVELDTGDAAVAETTLRQSYEMLDEMGGGGVLSTVAAMLGHALYEQSRFAEAQEFSEISERTGAADDVLTQIQWRAVRAKVLARTGDFAGGEALAREAVAVAERTDYLEDHAQALIALAEVLALDGRGVEAVPALEEAVRLYDQKESALGAARARARLRELAPEALAERE